MNTPNYRNLGLDVLRTFFGFLRGAMRLKPRRLFLFLRGFLRGLFRALRELVGVNSPEKFWRKIESFDWQETEGEKNFVFAEEELFNKDFKAFREATSRFLMKKLIPDLYVSETRSWMHDILGANSPEDVYQVISKRINNFLNGRYNPLFTPFSISKPELPMLIWYLKFNCGEMALSSLEKNTVDNILASLSNDNVTALVHLIVTDEGIFGLISQRGQPVEIVTCASMTRQKVENMLRGWLWLYYWHSRGMYDKTLETIAQEKISEEAHEVFKKAGWRLPYEKIFYSQSVFDNLQPTEVPVIDDVPSVPFPSWLLMEVVLRELGMGYTNHGEGLWGRLHQRLSERGVHRIILCPDKALALFPHHAAILGVDANGRKDFLLDHYAVEYLPQGQLSNIIPGQTHLHRILVVGDDNDAFSSIAVANLCRLAPEYIVTQPNASNPHVLKKIFPQVEAFTFVGHAQYDWAKPENSYLEMTNRKMSLKRFLDIIPPHLEIIVLAACEIGLPTIHTDVSEYRGFAEDLLLKGRIPVIISTLWPVHQVSTVLLIRQFHRYLLLGDVELNEGPLPVNTALSYAQKWLRNLTVEQLVKELHDLAKVQYKEEVAKEIESVRNQNLEHPYAHPYFWALFYMMGVTLQ